MICRVHSKFFWTILPFNDDRPSVDLQSWYKGTFSHRVFVLLSQREPSDPFAGLCSETRKLTPPPHLRSSNASNVIARNYNRSFTPSDCFQLIIKIVVFIVWFRNKASFCGSGAVHRLWDGLSCDSFDPNNRYDTDRALRVKMITRLPCPKQSCRR